jgi:hypothetical protein
MQPLTRSRQSLSPNRNGIESVATSTSLLDEPRDRVVNGVETGTWSYVKNPDIGDEGRQRRT